MIRSLKKLLLAAGLCALPFTALTSKAYVNFSITVAPPVIPVYEQPLCPEEGYLWTPGYWGYADDDYYWVPGAWVLPPRVGYLWTPGYWGFADGFYAFHSGYWGPTVGFYGGVNYGCGYNGYGYGGGGWRGDRFYYNTAVTRVNTTVIRNTYVNRTIVNERRTNSRLSFNGPGGINVRPNAEQRQAADGPHLKATEAQVERRRAAGSDRQQFAAVNGGRPARLVSDRVQGRGADERGNRQMGRDARNPADREAGGLQRQERVGRRQADGGNGLTPEERQLAERRENRPGRDFNRERQGAPNVERARRIEPGQERLAAAEIREHAQNRERYRQMQQRWPRGDMPEQVSNRGMQGRAERQEMRREMVQRQPQAPGPMRGEGQMRQPRPEGPRQGGGERRLEQRHERGGDRQER